ncbi:thiol peroxidase [Sulfurimonas sp. HSL1-6]|uniref:thiol peroxidase n=1 Tax=Thiomicrolovo immobilis TaxID=3131935 RepID=UPI0031F7661C
MRILAALTLSATLAFAQSVTFQGSPVALEGTMPGVGEKAPTFTAVKNDLSVVTIGGTHSKTQIIAFVPSIDTPVCSLESKAFDDKVKQMKGVDLYIVSMDLPFAQKRFCGFESIGNITLASAYKRADHAGASQYGVNIGEPLLKDLFTRAVFVVNKEGVITYRQLVPEIASEPDYNAVIKAVNKLN